MTKIISMPELRYIEPVIRELNRHLNNLRQPDAVILIERIGNGYVVRNTFQGLAEYCANKQELLDKWPMVLGTLPFKD